MNLGEQLVKCDWTTSGIGFFYSIYTVYKHRDGYYEMLDLSTWTHVEVKTLDDVADVCERSHKHIVKQYNDLILEREKSIDKLLKTMKNSAEKSLLNILLDKGWVMWAGDTISIGNHTLRVKDGSVYPICSDNPIDTYEDVKPALRADIVSMHKSMITQDNDWLKNKLDKLDKFDA